MAGSQPYRVPERRKAPEAEPRDPLGAAFRLVGYFVLGWAFLRLAVCSVRGIDFEGFVALVIFVAAVASLTRSVS
jgi:hypothetical protein